MKPSPISTHKREQLIDITARVNAVVDRSGVSNGLVSVYAQDVPSVTKCIARKGMRCAWHILQSLGIITMAPQPGRRVVYDCGARQPALPGDHYSNGIINKGEVDRDGRH